ncbi:RNA polymerase sigma factor, sigma-70 family [Sphingobacterium nematocida]|uniref:RNA polymerase sigma factor, sigma-70 family n=1 Tax=Sphingobacterium nematocida TaxID=1513896 RepID=A0A1T5EWZ7_9SPHI|nr:sigma-70 family RNA polymerase sigma factor [Sphingobacterium nematocida]SKB88411.1 RNA polymerase sigma factor, sigma-70 family [Sphingobacterium nematocida]
MSWVKFIEGDTSAFEQIYNDYVEDLYKYGTHYHTDHATVIDCIHDLFTDLFGNVKIAKEVNIKYYLFASLRRRLLRNKVAQDKFSNVQLEEILNWSEDNSFEQEEMKEEQIILLREKFEKLPTRQREVLFLKYYMDFKYEDIAEMMSIHIETCRTLSFRGMKQLRLELSSPEALSVIFFIIYSQ